MAPRITTTSVLTVPAPFPSRPPPALPPFLPRPQEETRTIGRLPGPGVRAAPHPHAGGSMQRAAAPRPPLPPPSGALRVTTFLVFRTGGGGVIDKGARQGAPDRRRHPNWGVGAVFGGRGRGGDGMLRERKSGGRGVCAGLLRVVA